MPGELASWRVCKGVGFWGSEIPSLGAHTNQISTTNRHSSLSMDAPGSDRPQCLQRQSPVLKLGALSQILGLLVFQDVKKTQKKHRISTRITSSTMTPTHEVRLSTINIHVHIYTFTYTTMLSYHFPFQRQASSRIFLVTYFSKTLRSALQNCVSGSVTVTWRHQGLLFSIFLDMIEISVSAQLWRSRSLISLIQKNNLQIFNQKLPESNQQGAQLEFPSGKNRLGGAWFAEEQCPLAKAGTTPQLTKQGAINIDASDLN